MRGPEPRAELGPGQGHGGGTGGGWSGEFRPVSVLRALTHTSGNDLCCV